jgi:6-pyruvoyltetrahydropterin/6-carboxytetrahydropterin synthase
MAKWIFDSLKKKITEDNIRMSSVTVWESDTASATYYES